MQITLKSQGKTVFEGFSTALGEISEAFGDVTLKFPQVRDSKTSALATLVVTLGRDEFIQVGVKHHASVDASLLEIAELISSGAGLRKIRERIAHWQRYWDLTDQEILEFLQRVESPLETLKRELSQLQPDRPKAFAPSGSPRLIH